MLPRARERERLPAPVPKDRSRGGNRSRSRARIDCQYLRRVRSDFYKAPRWRLSG